MVSSTSDLSFTTCSKTNGNPSGEAAARWIGVSPPALGERWSARSPLALLKPEIRGKGLKVKSHGHQMGPVSPPRLQLRLPHSLRYFLSRSSATWRPAASLPLRFALYFAPPSPSLRVTGRGSGAHDRVGCAYRGGGGYRFGIISWGNFVVKEGGKISGEIWGLWQCSVCVRQCKLWDLQGGRIFPLPKFSPAK